MNLENYESYELFLDKKWVKINPKKPIPKEEIEQFDEYLFYEDKLIKKEEAICLQT